MNRLVIFNGQRFPVSYNTCIISHIILITLTHHCHCPLNVATPEAAAKVGSPNYGDPKDNTQHNVPAAPHILDSPSNQILGLPEPLQADPLSNHPVPDLLDLNKGLTQWSLIDQLDTSINNNLPTPIFLTKKLCNASHVLVV